jgi:hypothetical protein
MMAMTTNSVRKSAKQAHLDKLFEDGSSLWIVAQDVTNLHCEINLA